MTRRLALGGGACVAMVVAAVFADGCSEPVRDGFDTLPDGSTEAAPPPPPPGFEVTDAGTRDADGPRVTVNPKTCAEAAEARTYVGCDFWPTVTANPVWTEFDFAVVLANTSDDAADYTVTGPAGFSATGSVAAGGTKTVYLPWVAALKGPAADSCGRPTSITSSVRVDGGAYHLVTTKPITLYQFNALEYQGAGGPAGKDWSTCPGLTPCETRDGGAVGCFSFTNDASLLLPTTALTGTYRVVTSGVGALVAITATEDATVVSMRLTSSILGGTSVGQSTPVATKSTMTLNRGDVVELVPNGDLSGSLIQANKPVQVLAVHPCTTIPAAVAACDHVEAALTPVEALAADYVVGLPPAPGTGQPTVMGLRLVGNETGSTVFSYEPPLPGCPTSLYQGEVAECELSEDVVVRANQRFVLSTFLYGGSLVDPSGERGDPAQSMVAPVEQYRTKYVFLAPLDYDLNYAIVAGPKTAAIVLDGQPVSLSNVVGGSTMGVERVLLAATEGGAHVITSDVPVGVTVIGYGKYTSYAYPAGLDLRVLAPAPPIE